MLDTGGGIKQGLPHFNNEPFFAVSGDSFWSNAEQSALQNMSAYWDADQMDLLLLLQPVDHVIGHAVGDYDFKTNNTSNGIINRSKSRTGTHMWTSVRICKPSLFKGTPDKTAFSFLDLMDKAQDQQSLYGLEHDGQWFHITTPEDLDQVNTMDLSQKIKRIA